MVAESKGDISQLPLQQGVITWLKSGQWNLSSRDVHLSAVPLKGRGVFSLPLPGNWSVGVGWWTLWKEQRWAWQSNKMEGAWVPAAVLAACGCFTREMKPLLFKRLSAFPGDPNPTPQNLGSTGPAVTR